MKKNNSYIEEIDILTDPGNLISKGIKNEVYREDYTDLIRSLTIYLFLNLTNRYSFISKKDRYHLLIPVLGYISGEWSTYIINTFYKVNESPSRKKIKKNSKIIAIKDIIINANPIFSYRENSEALYYDNSVRVLISIILDNDKEANKVIKRNIKQKIFHLKEAGSINKNKVPNIKKLFINFLRNIKPNNLICGYSFWSVLKILFLTANNDVKNIYKASRSHTNKFIENNIKISENVLEKYFSLEQKELFVNLVFLYLPICIHPKNVKDWVLKEKYLFLHPIKFCGPYVRDLKVIKSMFLQRLNKKIIIGSQHGSNYGYSFNHIKNDFSEFLLDGYISAGYTSEHTSNWPTPYLGFLPISPLFAKLLKKKCKENSIGNELSCLYVETQFDLSKSLSTDRMNYSPTYAKINTYKLIKSFLDSIDEKDFDKLYVKPWIFQEKISPLKDSNLMLLSNVKIIQSKLSIFIKKFNGLIILDDLSTPMVESIVLNKPILIIISRLNRHTQLGDKFFEKMVKNKYIVNSIDEAKKSIQRFQEDPKNYKENQIKIFKEFRSIYCNPKFYSPTFSAFEINRILKSKMKN